MKKKNSLNVQHYGQVFTPEEIVCEMLSLRKNTGTVLEPACGNGAFLKHLNQAVGIELDPNLIKGTSKVYDGSDHFESTELCDINQTGFEKAGALKAFPSYRENVKHEISNKISIKSKVQDFKFNREELTNSIRGFFCLSFEQAI